ncbi:MAG: DUF2752 domain-containing protein [Candidatus Omnitrophica bacterium]|nr:DUF2752 domain-containing protein [Candidatus Omnitrophota bacterium]MDD5653644.1 DUF2752 domain-containing protein [Candidatus Omnitrophota bacterium]
MRRSRDIILGYNLPFILWSIAAAAQVFFRHNLPLDFCPYNRFFGWCPACGLTASYAQFLKGQGFSNNWFAVIFLLFVGNFFFSILKALKLR